MQNILSKTLSFIQTVPTRWGTQVRSIQSIRRVEEPLKAYTILPSAADSLKPLLLKHSFWQRLAGLDTLFEPLHKLQIMSESNTSCINKVYPCWIEINRHFQQLRLPSSSI